MKLHSSDPFKEEDIEKDSLWALRYGARKELWKG